MRQAWPEIPYADWAETCAGLHMWSQIIGKYRLSLTPWVNHSWHATLYVTPRGFSTGPVPDKRQSITLTLDFCDHQLFAESASGAREVTALEPMSVAEFLSRASDLVKRLGGTWSIHGKPNEVVEAIAFADDTASRPYDADAVGRFHQALISIEQVFSHFRTGFLGKVSPAHLFWGSFDLAVTRFSGKPAPSHPGGFPNLPDSVTREAYSHEVSSAGFWPGGNGAEEAMFYSYAYPVPDGFNGQEIEPAAARFDTGLGEYLLPYDAVRSSSDPAGDLLAFLQSTYAVAANRGGWDRSSLECGLGVPGVPRVVP